MSVVSGGGSKCTTVCADCHQQLRYVNNHWVTLTGGRVCRGTMPHKPVAGESR